MNIAVEEQQRSHANWVRLNQTYLDSELRRLRFLLQRRVLWLRRHWRHDSLQNYRGFVISEDQADQLLAGEDREAESLYYREDKEAISITQSIREAEKELAKHSEALTEAGRPPALDLLALLFGLTPFEREVLLLCMAPDLNPAFERLYAYIQDDVNRKYATPHLALSLLAGEEWLHARNAFLPEAPLFRYQLVVKEPGLVTGDCPLRIDERIADYLRGVNRIDERVMDLLWPMPAALLVQGHRELLDGLERTVKSSEDERPVPGLNLIGPPGVGKRDLARALCDRLGLRLYELNVSLIPQQASERRGITRLIEREGLLLGFALYVDGEKIEDIQEQNVKNALTETIERLGTFIIIGSRERFQTKRSLVPVRVPKPSASDQLALWKEVLADSGGADGSIEDIIQQFDFGPRSIAQALETAKGLLRVQGSGENGNLDDEVLWHACREQAGWHMDVMARRITPCYTWDDIVLPEDVLRQLKEIAAQVSHRAQVYEQWGFGAKLSRGRGISALFSGPSGTGKTMAAEIMANHLNLDLYRIDLAGVVSKYIGETEKNLRKVFDAAEQSGAILFFDEADALFGERTEVRDSHDRYANIEVNYLLQRMEDYRGLAILATNRKSALDRAFLRRLRFQVDFPFPDAESRRRIWQKVFPSEAEVNELDYDILTRLEISGGNIRNIALNAAFLAAADGGAVGMAHVMHAARREYAKIEKMLTEAFGPYYGHVMQ